MKKTLARSLGAAIATLWLATAAQATPIYFDFTGSVLSTTGYVPGDSPAVGSAASGGFNIETDRLFDDGIISPGSHDWIDWQPVSPAAPLAFLSVDGRDVSFPLFPQNNYSLITFGDACTATDCGAGDVFTLFVGSGDGTGAADFTGALHFSALLFLPSSSNTDLFDAATVDPLSIVSLPVGNPLAALLEDTYTCEAGNCAISHSQQLWVSVDSVSRGVGERVGVPEPDTLALLVIAGLMCLLYGRRRGTLQFRRRPRVLRAG